jgi:hypothetical protein
MSIPKRVLNAEGRHSLVDGIPFKLPITCEKSPVLMAAFPVNAEKAQALLPGNEIFPLRIWNRGVLMITVVDYRVTTIGKYIEYSIAIACTHGSKPAPRLLPALFMKLYDTGQYVYDLPVSTEVSVKGGKGIWGMPKHQASLDFIIKDDSVSAQYDCDGQFAMKIEIARPRKTWLPINLGAVNFCEFRGMLFKSYIYFRGETGLELFRKAKATLTIGDHPRVRALKTLEIDPQPIFTAFIGEAHGVLDDHCESWFVSYPQPPMVQPEGLESVVNLGLGQEWPPPPKEHP